MQQSKFQTPAGFFFLTTCKADFPKWLSPQPVRKKMRQKNKGLIMCVLCFNSQWRSVVIGSVSTGLSLLILLTSLAYHSQVSLHLATKVQEQKCYQSEDVYVKRTNPSGSGNRSNECVFLAFSTLYPWPLWIILGLYILLSINLVISAVYK